MAFPATVSQPAPPAAPATCSKPGSSPATPTPTTPPPPTGRSSPTLLVDRPAVRPGLPHHRRLPHQRPGHRSRPHLVHRPSTTQRTVEHRAQPAQRPRQRPLGRARCLPTPGPRPVGPLSSVRAAAPYRDHDSRAVICAATRCMTTKPTGGTPPRARDDLATPAYGTMTGSIGAKPWYPSADRLPDWVNLTIRWADPIQRMGLCARICRRS
jgi:hypothetical protein